MEQKKWPLKSVLLIFGTCVLLNLTSAETLIFTSGTISCLSQSQSIPSQQYSQESSSSQSESLVGVIKGRILDYETQEPIKGVSVAIKESDLEVLSSEDGSYAFSDIPVGFYILTFQIDGYYTDTRTDVIVRSNRTTFLNIQILKVRKIEEQVDVTADYFPKTQTQTGSQLEINAEELRRDAASAGDVSRALYNVPGVIKADEEANDLIVRGGSPTENGFYIDNIFVPNINHFPQMGASGGNISMLNMDFIERIQIYTGGFDASYGNRLSSILDIGYREGNRERINSQVNFSIIGYGAQIEGPLPNNKGSWMISANRSFLDLIRKLISDEEQQSSFNDIQGKMNYDINENNKLSLLFLGGHSQTLYDPGAEKFDQMTVGMNWRHLWGGVGYSDTSVSYSSQKGNENFWDSYEEQLVFNFEYKNEYLTLRNVNQFQISPSHQLKFGFEAQNIIFQSLDYYDESTQKFKGIFGGAFLTYVVYPFQNFSLSTGIRLDYFPFSERTHVSPRVNFSWELT
ncbi:MAG: TonB-dependent receptor, partial [Anaerolineales bacterium]